MRQTLAQLELISHGRAMRVDGRVTGTHDRSPILRQDPEPYPHEHFRALWRRARNDDERGQLVEDARAALDRLRKAPPPPEHLMERFSLAWKRMLANDDETPIAELARLHDVSRKTIYKYRAMYRDGDADAIAA